MICVAAVMCADLTFAVTDKEKKTMGAVQNYLEKDDVSKAVKTMRKALKKNPGDCDMWNDLGGILMAQGDTKGAKEAFEKGVEADDMRAISYSNLGMLALSQNDAEDALRNLITATELDASYVPGQYNLGMYYTRRQRFSSAMDTFTKVLTLDPSHAGALFAMARIKRMTGAPKEALKFYAKALASNPDYAEGRIEYAMLYFALDNKATGEEILRDCIRRYRKNADAYYALGVFLRDTGDLAESARSLKQAVALDEKNPQFKIDYALVLLYQTGRKDPAAGIVQIEKALKIAPKDGKTVYMSAIFYDDAGMLKEAAKLYRKAIALGYKAEQAKAYLAEALIKLGDSAGAAQVISELDKELAADSPIRAQLAKLKGGLQ